jgi:hypothetical protein
MIKTAAFWLLWVGFIAYAVWLAPPNQPDTFTLIQQLSTGQWDGINPLVIALFNIMGVLPLLYSSVLFFDGHGQRLPAWLFVAGSFGVGAFAILPYLALRRPNPSFVGQKDWLLKLLDSRWTAIAIAAAAIALLTYGLAAGDWSNFIQQWRSDRFIHVMSLDFCLLCLLFPALLGDDMARRGVTNPILFWAVALVPLLGAIAYLVLRPPLNPTAQSASASLRVINKSKPTV